MSSTASKISKLFRLRTVRRKAAEQRAAAARHESAVADRRQEERRVEYVSTVDNAQSTRMRRMKAIFDASQAHGLHQASAVAAYEMTQQEINDARQSWRDARIDADMARMRSELAQRDLARAMQVEEKVKHLSRKLFQRENEDAARQE
jgi:hypothetical protein